MSQPLSNAEIREIFLADIAPDLQAQVDRARSDERYVLVFVGGQPGAGKSRLVAMDLVLQSCRSATAATSSHSTSGIGSIPVCSTSPEHPDNHCVRGILPCAALLIGPLSCYARVITISPLPQGAG